MLGDDAIKKESAMEIEAAFRMRFFHEDRQQKPASNGNQIFSDSILLDDHGSGKKEDHISGDSVRAVSVFSLLPTVSHYLSQFLACYDSMYNNVLQTICLH
jgi:hypothetical protein